MSNHSGIAQELWTIGTSTADSQVVEVRAVDNTTGQPKVFARFVAIPVADAAVAFTGSGDGQQGFVAIRLSDSIAVVAEASMAIPLRVLP